MKNCANRSRPPYNGERFCMLDARLSLLTFAEEEGLFEVAEDESSK